MPGSGCLASPPRSPQLIRRATAEITLPLGTRYPQSHRPHIAAKIRAITAATMASENIRRGEAGEALLYQVDRARGY